MSTKGKRMADNSGKEENISSESYKYGAYERNKEREEENNMRKKKKMNKGLKIFLIILLVLVIFIVGTWCCWIYICKWKNRQNAKRKH